jgi:hypothetical protein
VRSKNNLQKSFIGLFLLVILLFSSCFQPEDEIISDGAQRLIIENAFYHNTLTGKCIIEFDYYVTEDTCKIGGYGVDWGDGRGSFIDYYIMSPIIPGIKYTIEDEFRQWAVLRPIIGMYGYPLHENDTFTILYAEDTLRLR